MDALAIGGILAVLLIKEAGVPIPVPGDLIVIGAGVALAGEPSLAVVVLVLILAAGYVGGTIQFVLARKVLRRPLLAALARVGVGEARVEALAARLEDSGARGVALARMTPGVRIGAIVAAGLAALPFAPFITGLVAGNGVFIAGHFALGYAVGASATQLIGGAGGMALVVAGAVALAGMGALGWTLLRRSRRRAADEGGSLGDWTDAACPACLAVSMVRFRPD